MSTTIPSAPTPPAEAGEVGALRAQVEHLECRLAQVTKLLRTAQESCMVWEQTFNAVSDPVAVISSDYRVLRANAAYRRLLGDVPAWSERRFCFEGASGPCARCPLAETVLSRRPGHVRSEVMVPGDAPGSEESRTIERWIYPIVSADGTVDRVVEIVKDVTEEERLRDATSAAEALRQADRLKAELLGTVSHELRSPLASIQGYAETLQRHEKRLPTAERHEFLTAIQQAGKRLSMIVDRLLLLSELDTGSYPLKRTPVDLARTVREAMAGIHHPGGEPGTGINGGEAVSFALRIEDAHARPVDTLPLVLGDARLLRDLLDHLLENAVKYSPEGGTVAITLHPRVSPTLFCPRAPDEYVTHVAPPLSEGQEPAPDHDGTAGVETLEVTVQDEGIGIPAEHLPRVFERFHRVDSSLTREVGGMGLGLAICQRIVELHHGKIWAESVAGGGSSFHVRLPLAEVE